jgi:uncharacterized repeat protein (TIGR04076 family)
MENLKTKEMTNKIKLRDDQFVLYDLEVVVEQINGNCTCNMAIGDSFYLKGGKISLPENSDFCLYALQSTIPLLPIKQRQNHPADWIETDSHVTCPDPACGLIMNMKRKNPRVLNHDDVSAIKMKKDEK